MENEENVNQFVEPDDLPENPGVETEDLHLEDQPPLKGEGEEVIDTASELERELRRDIKSPERTDAD